MQLSTSNKIYFENYLKIFIKKKENEKKERKKKKKKEKKEKKESL